MKEQNTEGNFCNTIIKIIKIVGEVSQVEGNSRAKAVLSMESELINILSKRLQVFLKDNQLSGGIMDINIDTYEFELILKDENHIEDIEKKTAASYMINFIDFLRKDYNLIINNNFDGLEVTADELEKLLISTSI